MSKGSTVSLTDKILAALEPNKKFNYHQEASITSLDFDDSGQYLISSGIDKSIQLYDVHKGVHHKSIQSQKYGAHAAKFTHKDLNCLYASTPTDLADIDNAIRYLSLVNNQYIRYFKGHKAQVMSIEVSPCEDVFLSSSLDGTVKLWDLQSQTPVGNLDIGLSCLVAFDPQGIVFAVGNKYTNTIDLYDIKTFDKEPFLTIRPPKVADQIWTKIEFSNNGKLVLVLTNSYEHYIFDSFLSQLLTTLKTECKVNGGWLHSKYPTTGSGTFSPCGKFVIIGSPDSSLQLFDLRCIKTTDGNKHILHSDDNPKSIRPYKVIKNSPNLPRIVTFDPKLLVLATADNTVALWKPPLD
jgi:COMPASS component SWD2